MPCNHHKTVKDQYVHRGHDMAASQLDEHMVQVSLVGTERRTPLEHTGDHNPQGVEYGNGQHRERETYGTARDVIAAGLYHTHHIKRAYETKHQRAAVSEEHLVFASEHIVQQERYKAAEKREGHDSIRYVAHADETYAIEQRGKHSVARTQAVDTVDKVDRVDYTHTRHQRQCYGGNKRQSVYAPQPVEVVDVYAAQEHHHANGEYLQGETHRG